MKDQLLQLATMAAARSAQFLVDGWAQRSVVSTKSSASDVVTQMDRGSEELLVETIRAERPDDAILGEEGGQREGSTGVRWVIDPLDGTVNYLYGLPMWSVSVGVLIDDQPAVGVVHAPRLGSVWRGVAGQFAEVNGEALSASDCARPEEALVATGFGYEAQVRAQQGRIVADLLPRVRDIRRGGAASVDLCWVAQGLVDAYFERGTHLWDRAAAMAICQAAGVTVGGPTGGPAEDAMTVAANPSLYGPLCTLLTEVGGEALSKSERYLRYLAAEREAAQLYRALADMASGDRKAALLELAGIEQRHAAHWMSLLHACGADIPPDPGALERGDETLVRRARDLGLDAVLGDLEQAERDAQDMYDAEPDALPGMADDERRHAGVLAGLADQPASVAPNEVRAQLNRAEPWHHTDKSGTLRAAIFGVSDGLVSNTALVMGFAGSGTSGATVLFAGIAGLLAGAFSMAAGEYVSVASQTDMFRRELALEAQELRENPQEEQRELELLYRAKGLDAQTARATAAEIMSNPETALDTLAREELGLDPADLGDPKRAAASSFAAFSVGAALPVIPYTFLPAGAALALAVTLVVIALLLVGGAVGRMSGLGMTRSALRQLAVGGGAATVTYIVGHLVGGSVG